MKRFLLIQIVFAHLILSYAQTSFLDSSAAYYGQTKPGNTPVVFAPGDVFTNTTHCENTCSFSPDGKTMVFTRWIGSNTPKIFYSEYNGNSWTTPVEKNFTGNLEMEAIFAPYGNQMFFASGASFPDDIWMVEKNGSIWENLGKKNSISTSSDVEFYASLTLDTTMYFQRTWSGIYYSKYKNGAFSTPVKLGNTINSSTGVTRHPFISKDGSYLIFEKGDGNVDNDIWISFQNADKIWLNPIKLGNNINTTQFECQPTLSPDEKFLFFRRSCAPYWVRIDHVIDSLKSIVLGTNEISANNKIKVFPNPTTGLIDVSLNKPFESNYKIEVFSSLGNIAQTTGKQKGVGSAQIDLSGCAAGMYLIRVNLKDNTYQACIIKH
jgi:Tol biopolymer transport system component